MTGQNLPVERMLPSRAEDVDVLVDDRSAGASNHKRAGVCDFSQVRRQALGELSEELRTTVFLVLGEGLRHAEAGEVLGISEKTVSWRMHEVRRRLRALAAEEETA